MKFLNIPEPRVIIIQEYIDGRSFFLINDVENFHEIIGSSTQN